MLLIIGDYDSENAILMVSMSIAFSPSYRAHPHTWWKLGAVFGILDRV